MVLDKQWQRSVRWTTTYGSRVDGDAVVLVVDAGPRDGDPRAGADVEAVRILRAEGIARRAVDGDAAEGEVGAAIDAEHLDRRVHDVDARDRRGDQVVRLEELWLGLPSARAAAVPPEVALPVQSSA